LSHPPPSSSPTASPPDLATYKSGQQCGNPDRPLENPTAAPETKSATPAVRNSRTTPRRASSEIKTLGRSPVPFVVVHFGEFRIDDVVLCTTSGVARARATLLGLLVHGLAEFHRSLRKRIGFGADRGGIIALERFLKISECVLNGAAFVVRNLGA